MRDHRGLRSFELIHRLVLEVYRLSHGFPSHEIFGLTAQVRRASVSAAANVVEGAARRSERDFDRFLDIAFGSLREVGYLLSLGS